MWYLFTTGATNPPPMLKSSDFFGNVLSLVLEFLDLAPAVIYLAIGLVKTREHVLIWAPMWISFIKIIN